MATDTEGASLKESLLRALSWLLRQFSLYAPVQRKCLAMPFAQPGVTRIRDSEGAGLAVTDLSMSSLHTGSLSPGGPLLPLKSIFIQGAPLYQYESPRPTLGSFYSCRHMKVTARMICKNSLNTQGGPLAPPGTGAVLPGCSHWFS